MEVRVVEQEGVYERFGRDKVMGDFGSVCRNPKGCIDV